MFDNLNVRNKFLAVTAVPVNVAVIVAVWAALAGEVGIAALAVAGAVATVTAAVAVAGSVATRVAELSQEADELAAVRLPGILAGLPVAPTGATPAAAAATADDEASSDEIAVVATALAAIEERVRAAVEAEAATVGPEREARATEQAAVEAERAGIATERAAIEAERADAAGRLGGLIQNLARRSQSLLDRQIEHLDWLEAKEQDPERLEQLFKLDHLATRMRRSSESVLVLGGAEPTRRRGGPAPVADVLRVAMGETEDYRNIRLRTVDPVLIAGGPAFELSHLLAEVLENATQFSPPDVPVELHATGLDDGRYRVTVIDRGVGMDEAALARANATIVDPPEISLTMGNSVGFIVIGRLARRLGATVELSATPVSGVTAEITVPASAIVERVADDTEPAADAAATAAAAPAEAAPAPTAAAPLDKLVGLQAELPETGGWQPPAVGGKEAKPLRARETAPAAEAAPAAEPADADAPIDDVATGDGEPWAPPAPPERRGGPDRPARTLAEAIPTGSAFDSGVDSLLAPTDDDDDEPVTPEAAADDETWTPPEAAPPAGGTGTGLTRRDRNTRPAEPPTRGPGAKASNRSAEEKRSMLTRYRAGLKGDQTGIPGGPETGDAIKALVTAAEVAAQAEAPDTASDTSSRSGDTTPTGPGSADTTTAPATDTSTAPVKPAPRSGPALPGRSAKPQPRRNPRSDRRPNQEGK